MHRWGACCRQAPIRTNAWIGAALLTAVVGDHLAIVLKGAARCLTIRRGRDGRSGDNQAGPVRHRLGTASNAC